MTLTLNKPVFDSLDTCEGKWPKNINAQINIRSMILASEIILLTFLSTRYVH